MELEIDLSVLNIKYYYLKPVKGTRLLKEIYLCFNHAKASKEFIYTVLSENLQVCDECQKERVGKENESN